MRAAVALKIYGEDADTLRTLAETLRDKIAAVPGLADLQVEKQARVPEVRIKVDYERAALYGVSATSITEGIEALASGRVVSQILDGPRRFDVVMRLDDAQRSTTACATCSSPRRPA